ncbi:MAG TPA: WGxxGxxG family protein [Sphingomicrobium sp.]
MRTMALFIAAAFLSPSAAAIAQTTDTGEVDVRSDSDDNGDDNSKLGLLGLLGLAGLLGLKRREPDIHVDARRGSRADR